MRFSLSLFLLVSVAGCGGSGLSTNPDIAQAVPDQAVMPPDLAVTPPDLAMPPPDLKMSAPIDAAGIACGAKTCPKGEVCCGTVTDAGTPTGTCAKSCPDGGITISCDGPEECGGAQAFCCGKVKVPAGQFPGCAQNFTSASAMCTAKCFTDIPFKCDTTFTLRLCHKGAECADDKASQNCCDLKMGGQGFTACVSDIIKNVVGMGGGMCYP